MVQSRLNHNDKLRAVLSTGPSRPAVDAPPIGRLLHGYRWLLWPWRLFWGQPSLPMSIEVATVVVVLMLLAQPGPRLMAPPLPTPPPAALLRTASGAVWSLPLGHDLVPLSDPGRSGSRILMQDPTGIVTLDDRSGQVQSHLAIPLVSQLLPGPHGGRWFGLGPDRTSLFEICPETLVTRCVLSSPAAVGDVARAGSETYVSFPDADRVTRLDRNLKVQTDIPVPGGPSTLWLRPDGSELWVVCTTSHDVKIIELTDLPRVHLVVPGPADDVIGMVGGDDHVFLVGRHTVTSMETWAPDHATTADCAGRDPVGWAFSPAGHALLVATATPPLVEAFNDPRHIDYLPLAEPPTNLWLP